MSGRAFWFRRQAERDLTAILDYFAAIRPELADAFMEETLARCEKLAEFPGSGALVPTEVPLLKPLRRARVSSRFHEYVILYLPTENGIDVLRIVHGARNLPWLHERWH